MKLLREKFSILGFLAFFCFCSIWHFPSTAFAAIGQWTGLGPWGGDVECLLAVSPSILYAGTQNGGVFKSSDGGAHWVAVNNGLGNPTVFALAVDPAAPANLYAATYGNGIYKSLDAGSSWSRLAASPASVYSLAVDPADSSTLYAGTDGGGVYKSTDGGATWNAANAGIPTAQVNALVVDPRLTTTVYAATANGIFRSPDGGANWSLVADTGWTRDIAISSVTPATLYAATGAGIFRSNDGATWTSAGLSGISVYALAINPADPAKVFAGTTAGIFGSADSGANWTLVANGLTNANVQTIIFDPSDTTNSSLFAGTWGGGVFKTSNSGNDWQSANQGLGNTFVQAVVTDPSAPATVYAGSIDGIHISTDGGATWLSSSSGLGNGDVEALLVNPMSPTQLYAGTWGGGVYKSVDGGASWMAANTGMSSALVHAVAMDAANPQVVYAGTNSGIFISSGGSAWNLCSNGIPADTEVWSVLTAANSVVYAGTGTGFYRSSNGGIEWTQSNTGLAPCGVVYGLAADPTADSTLYAATCGGVYKSTDGGVNWTWASSGIGEINVYNLTFTGTAPVIIYAGTDSGVFVSRDAAATWNTLNTGLTNGDIYAVAVAGTSPATIYAGTWGGGVFSLTSTQDISVSPPTLDLGYRVASGNSASQTVTISNGGASDLVIGSLAITGAGAAAFSVTPGTCSSLTPTILPGGSCTLNLVFAPPSGGPYAANLELASNSGNTPVVNVSLNGIGVFPLSVFLGGTGSGGVSVSAEPPVDAGLVCSPASIYCGAFERGSSIILTPSADSTSYFSGWSGCPMTMGDSCFITMNNAVNATANFVRLTSLQAIIDAALGDDIIKLPITTYVENVVMNQVGKSLTLSGGWADYSFLSQTGFTNLQGSLTIANGTLILENFQII
ncbi:choice-of-anchor D domain-containing protein [Geotalea toluenoxydans]